MEDNTRRKHNWYKVPSGSSTSIVSFSWFFWCACWNFVTTNQISKKHKYLKKHNYAIRAEIKTGIINDSTHHEVAYFFFIQLTKPLCVEKLEIMPENSRQEHSSTASQNSNTFQWEISKFQKQLQLRHARNSRFFWFCWTTLAHCLLEVFGFWVTDQRKDCKEEKCVI